MIPAKSTAREPGGFRRARLLAPVLLLIGIGVIFLSFEADDLMRGHVAAAQGPDWKNSTRQKMWGTVSRQGDWPQLMIAGAIGLAVSIRFRNVSWTRAITAAMIASTLAGMLANASRLTTGRVRPRYEQKLGAGFQGLFHEDRLTLGDSRRNSFPSGHTATAFGFAVPFALFFPGFGWVALGGAAAIAYSRMILGAHHFSDVVTSIVLSIAIGWLVSSWVRNRGDAAWHAIRARWNARFPGK